MDEEWSREWLTIALKISSSRSLTKSSQNTIYSLRISMEPLFFVQFSKTEQMNRGSSSLNKSNRMLSIWELIEMVASYLRTASRWLGSLILKERISLRSYNTISWKRLSIFQCSRTFRSWHQTISSWSSTSTHLKRFTSMTYWPTNLATMWSKVFSWNQMIYRGR